MRVNLLSSNKGNSLLWFLLDSAGSKLIAAPATVETAITLDQHLIKKVRNGEALAAAIFARQKLTQKTICTPVHTSESRRADHARHHRQNFRSISKIAVIPAMIGTNEKVKKS